MAWLSRVNFTASDVLSYTDLNNLGNDIRAWGGNVNGGAYTLSNVVLSASSGTMATVIGGTGTTSTLTLRSTSGVGTTGADIVFQTGNNGATEVMRLQNGGNVGIGTSSAGSKLTLSDTNKTIDGTGNLSVFTTNAQAANLGGSIGLGGLNGTAGAFDPWSFATIKGAKENATSGNFAGYFAIGTAGSGGTIAERMRIDSSGNVGIGTSSPSSLGKLAVVGGNIVASGGGIIDPEFRLTAPSGGTTRTYAMGVDSGAKLYWYDYTAAQYRMVVDSSGNVKIGGTADRATTAGAAHLDIFNGTAPAGTLANGISIYSSSGEAYVMDAAGNATLFSPHDRETNEWIFDSTDTRTGKRLKINVERLLRFINDHFGLDCVHDLMEEA